MDEMFAPAPGAPPTPAMIPQGDNRSALAALLASPQPRGAGTGDFLGQLLGAILNGGGRRPGGGETPTMGGFGGGFGGAGMGSAAGSGGE